MGAATAHVTFPLLLEHATGGAREAEVPGATLQECLENLFARYPVLHGHLFYEDGTQREHVLILYNGQNTRWFDSLDFPMDPGSTITILQAVSGG